MIIFVSVSASVSVSVCDGDCVEIYIIAVVILLQFYKMSPTVFII